MSVPNPMASMNLRLCLSIFAGLLAASALSAQSIVTLDYTEVFAPSTDPLVLGGYHADGTTPNFPVTVSAPAFDSNLGTLESVTLTLDSAVGGDIKVVNLNSAGLAEGFTDATSSSNVTVTGPAGTSVSDTPVSTLPSGTAAGPFGTASYFAPTVDPTASNSAGIAASQFGWYEIAGGGTVQFMVNSMGNGSYSGNANNSGQVAFSGDAAVSGDVRVQYTYLSQIPEPATYAAALGLGAFALALVRRLRLA